MNTIPEEGTAEDFAASLGLHAEVERTLRQTVRGPRAPRIPSADVSIEMEAMDAGVHAGVNEEVVPVTQDAWKSPETHIAMPERTPWEETGEWQKYGAFVAQNGIYSLATSIAGVIPTVIAAAAKPVWIHPAFRAIDGAIAATQVAYAMKDLIRRSASLKATDSLNNTDRTYIACAALIVGLLTAVQPTSNLPKRIYGIGKGIFEATFPGLTSKFSVKHADATTLLTDGILSSAESFGKAEIKNLFKTVLLLAQREGMTDLGKGMTDYAIDTVVDAVASLIATPGFKALSRYMWGAEYDFTERSAVLNLPKSTPTFERMREPYDLLRGGGSATTGAATTKLGYAALPQAIADTITLPFDRMDALYPTAIPASARMTSTALVALATASFDVLKSKMAVDSPEANFDKFDHPSFPVRPFERLRDPSLFHRIAHWRRSGNNPMTDAADVARATRHHDMV